jgi:Spy/CpxP family protein refolding chaperone
MRATKHGNLIFRRMSNGDGGFTTNMKMKRLFLIVAIGASTLGVAGQTITGALADAAKSGTYARPYGYGQRGGGHMMERMAQELKLTGSQKTRLQKIMKESRDHRQQIRDSKSLSQTQKRQKMRENSEATRKRIDAILTPGQRKKLAAMRAQMRSQHRQNGGQFRNGPFGGPHNKI